jgi:hypothetical protein
LVVTTSRHIAADLDYCSFPPDAGNVVRVRDIVAVEMIDVPGDVDLVPEYTSNPPAGVPRYPDDGPVFPDPAEIGRGINLGALTSDEAELILAATELRGHYFRATSSDGIRYSFSRDITADATHPRRYVDISSWDADGAMYDAVVLSRLIRENAAGLARSVRFVDYESGATQVVPQEFHEAAHTYRLPLVERDWLDDADAAALRELLALYWERRGALPHRVTRALHRAEFSVWTRQADLAIPLIVAGFEALITTRIGKLTANFKRRLPMLAEIVGIEGVNEEFAERLYVARSDGVLGRQVDFVEGWTDDAIRDFRLAQRLLRRVVRRLIESQEFSEHFTEKATIDDLSMAARGPTSRDVEAPVEAAERSILQQMASPNEAEGPRCGRLARHRGRPQAIATAAIDFTRERSQVRNPPRPWSWNRATAWFRRSRAALAIRARSPRQPITAAGRGSQAPPDRAGPQAAAKRGA